MALHPSVEPTTEYCSLEYWEHGSRLIFCATLRSDALFYFDRPVVVLFGAHRPFKMYGGLTVGLTCQAWVYFGIVVASSERIIGDWHCPGYALSKKVSLVFVAISPTSGTGFSGEQFFEVKWLFQLFMVSFF